MITDELRDKSLAMAQSFVDGYRIKGIGGIVYKFKIGAEDSGCPLMLCEDAVRCRSWLAKNGISMSRIDSGGSPEWNFRVF